MPDPARIAQAEALEVPVIVQGATTVAGADTRELFSENAKTTLVFDDGAVLHLRSKVTVGQAIFLHNQHNGREVLCKVIEAPEDGESGHTQLEFNAPAPGFWLTAHEQRQAPPAIEAATTPETPAPPEKPAEDNLAMMSETASKIELSSMAAPGAQSAGPSREELVPAHEAVPEPTIELPTFHAAGEPTEPTGEQIDAALKQMYARPNAPAAQGAAGATVNPPDAAEPDNALTDAHLAAMMAREARFAKFAAAKQKRVSEKTESSTSQEAPLASAAPAAEATAGDPIVIPKVSLLHRLTSQQKALIGQIAAGVLVVVALGFIWHAMKGIFIHPSVAPVASSVPVTSPPTAPPVATQTPPAQVTKAPETPPAVVAAIAPIAKSEAKANARTKSKSEASSSARESDEVAPDRNVAATERASETPKSSRSIEPNSASTVPARILYQSQPSIPPWAKSLDLESVVVKLDAVIDEKGNVTEAKVLSGPRSLQHSAEEAVALWQFAPAQSDGQPMSSHMVLVVEFQR